MPSSYTEGKQTTAKWLTEINPKTALDIGPGCGTYAFLLSGAYGAMVNGTDYAKGVSDIENDTFVNAKIDGPLTRLVGVEAYYPYIEKYCLSNYYTEVIVADVRFLNWKKLDKDGIGHTNFLFDVGFAGDILEHLTEEEAKEVFENLKRVCKNVIISIPIIHFEQGAIGGNPFETNKEEDWTDERFRATFGEPKKSYVGKAIGVYLY